MAENFEHLKSLGHYLLVLEKTKQLGRTAAKEGTEQIEDKLNQLLKVAQRRGIYSDVPPTFLESACRKLWEDSHSIEPIFYLYDKYYTTEFEEGCILGWHFPDVMGQIAAETQNPDRNILINGTIELITKHEDNPTKALTGIIDFARELYEHGAQIEARGIARLLREMHPDLIDMSQNLQEDINEILGT